MATTNQNPFAQFTEMFSGTQSPFPNTSFFELAALATRKNIEAMTAVNQAAFECAQSLAQQSTQMAQSYMDTATKASQDSLSNSSPEDKACQQADYAQKAIQQLQKASQDMAKLIEKTTTQAANTLNKRMNESFSEFKSAVKSSKTA